MEIPAGVYNVESEDDVLDDMFLPDCLRPSVLVHLHAQLGIGGCSRTLRVAREELELGLRRDRAFSRMQEIEAGLRASPSVPNLRFRSIRGGR